MTQHTYTRLYKNSTLSNQVISPLHSPCISHLNKWEKNCFVDNTLKFCASTLTSIAYRKKISPSNAMVLGILNGKDYMVNVDANVVNLNDYAGTSGIIESCNSRIPSRNVSSISMSNFKAYRNNLKKIQHWPHSLLTRWGWWMKLLMVMLEVPRHLKRVSKNIL